MKTFTESYVRAPASEGAAGTAVDQRTMANALRALAFDAVQKANSGHPGMPMGMADVATVLFTKFMKFDPKAPNWADRDRFVLSAGHGSMLLYGLLHLTGYEDFTLEELQNFRQLGAKTAGHPEFGHGAGIETTTGPLGQGIATAVGMAIAEKMLAARYGNDIVDHHTYVIAGDGCLMEGISHEAIDLAGHLGLGKLVVLWDDNSISIDGATSLSTSMDQMKRFEAAGWSVRAVDGHDAEAIEAAIAAEQMSDKPSLIACKTVIGYGSPNKQGTAATHGAPLGDDEIVATREALGWPHGPFKIPADVRDAWLAAGAASAEDHAAWSDRVAAMSADQRTAFEDAMAGKIPGTADDALIELRAKFATEAPKLATRQSSQKTLEVLVPAMANIVGGSADLTHSNLTVVKGQPSVTPSDFSGNYIHYGIREHGMAAAMNGIALHGGMVPYGGTFLVFADYCRPAIRLAALMNQRVIYVFTHDSIGLGEDGPTHQPVEHLASLRAIPNLNVFRPADAVETAEAWQAALHADGTPSLLALSRQGLPTLRAAPTDENLTQKGGYVLKDAENRDVTLIATGSEVALALAASELLAKEGVKAAVVSMPCFELFYAQDQAYQDAVLGTAPRVGVEAAIRQGWDRVLGCEGAFVGMNGFGASAPAGQLYEHFGITAEAVAGEARKLLG
ncbi:MAG: transketolase [Hyphomicrobiales bacterium]|nr:MAG: transketolase [Hyphomicrobiales bacterium]